ncbi:MULTISPECIES: trigger factor [unclassified Spirosoma]|uniref:trigger factor n=1 Tax=unclassified Spirosoma TaxID=2621999 RepID=UPI00095A9D50|nr:MULTISPECIES: trigger factor [unclassified Spirosoma]MBN8822519.1 trigger factor [Spirosoma sp.]OJW74022.1 MAG: trigger factor [Spirosoma sp. 48-14]
MDITLEKASDTNASLKITLTPADYKPEVDKKLKDYGRKVQLKGFRPGHVPASLVQKMYGKSILVDEINSMLSKTVSQYIRDNKLQVVGDPVPNREEADAIDWDNQTDFAFSYTLGLASEFDIDFNDLPSVTQYEIQAGDAEINSTIAELQQRFHTHSHGEEVADGDTIYGELNQVSAPEGATGFSAKTAFPMAKMADDAKGQFIGKKKGDVITFVLEQAFPDEKARANATGAKVEEVANLTGEFTFAIDDITRHEPAELNQELFDKVLGAGAVSDEEQFRAKVAEIIQSNYARETAQLLRLDIEKTLLDSTPILLPDEFLKNWLMEVNEGKFTPEQIDEQYDDFTKSVKLQLIKNKIAEKADIKVDFEEVMEATRQMVREQFGFASSEDAEMNQTIDRIARNYLMDEKNNGQNYTSTFNRVYDDKVIDYAKTQLTLATQEVTVDEFKALVENR